MKTLKLIALVTLTALISCDNNDDTSTTTLTDGFTYNNTFYETPNAYIEIDEDDNDNNGSPDSYSFFFTDGRMFDNDNNVNGSTGDFLFSLNTTTFVFLKLNASDNPSLVSSPPVAGNTYVVSSVEDSVVLHNGLIDPLSPPYITNGIEFGMGNENIATIHTPGISNLTLTLNSIYLDTNTSTNSSINVDYIFRDSNGDLIEGHYEGTFGIILD